MIADTGAEVKNPGELVLGNPSRTRSLLVAAVALGARVLKPGAFSVA